MLNQEINKAIFISGMPNSGKTIVGRAIAEVSAISYFESRTKFISDPAFQAFPEWITKLDESHKRRGIELFKRLCRTRFFSYYRNHSLFSPVVYAWDRLDRLWLRRFNEEGSIFWDSGIGMILERLWLSSIIQSRSWAIKPSVNKRSGLRGLNRLFSLETVEESLNILNKWGEVKEPRESYHVLGAWWSHLYNHIAHSRDAEKWIDEKPAYIHYGRFLEKCFDDLKLIYVKRDPKEAAAISCQERLTQARRAGRAISAVSKKRLWTECLEKNNYYALKARNEMRLMSPKSFICVEHADFVTHTNDVIKRLLNYLEVDKNPLGKNVLDSKRLEAEETCVREWLALGA
jgi:hypothetical protein